MGRVGVALVTVLSVYALDFLKGICHISVVVFEISLS